MTGTTNHVGHDRHRRNLLDSAGALLRMSGCEPSVVRVQVYGSLSNDIGLVCQEDAAQGQARTHPDEGDSMCEFLASAFLSPAEREIVLAVAEQPLSAKEISARLSGDASPGSSLKLLLSNLVARGVLARGGDGYRPADPRAVEVARGPSCGPAGAGPGSD